MRLPHLLLAATAALLCTTASLRAQETFETLSGSTYQGKLLSKDGTSVEIQTTDGLTVKVPMDQLTPATHYRLRLADAKDGKALLELADWCVTQTLYPQAKSTYRKALAADALMADEINAHIVKARTTAANEVLARAKKLEASNQQQEARRLLSTLVQELPLEEASKEAAQLLATETTQRKQDALSRKPARAAAEAAPAGPDAPRRASGEPFSDETRTLFKDVIESYHKMLDATQEGLTKGDSAGIKETEKALKEGEKIRKALDKLRPQAGNSEEITEAVTLADEKLEEAVVDARINLVDSYLLRTSYNQAADVVKEGLAQYPKNERLRQAMNQVTSATAENGGGGWGLGLRR